MQTIYTIKEAKELLRSGWEKGVKCPCCGQLVRKWNKPLIGTAVADLIRLVRIYEDKGEPIHISSFTAQRSNFYTLSYWGLIEKGEIEVDAKKRSSGYWVPTQQGIDFVHRKKRVLSIAETYNNILVGFSGKGVDVKEALGKKFDYEELMNT